MILDCCVATPASHNSLPSSPIPSCLLGFTYFCQAFRVRTTYASTLKAAKPVLQRVRQYLITHLPHFQYRQFKKLGFPIGLGMVESACKWLIVQRFKGTGMRWSETRFSHLLCLRLAWVNERFDGLFTDHSLTPTLYSPNH